MSCRTGPLRSATPQTRTCLWGPRFGRAFARLFKLLWRYVRRWASRCSALLTSAIGRAVMIELPRPVYTPRSGRPPRRRPVRQDIRYSAEAG